MLMLKEHVYQSVKNRIILQNLKPGSQINEKELMQHYEIGKTPLREVFFRLQQDGLIRRFPRSGTIVAPIDFKELRDAAEIRIALEALVGSLAAKRASPAVLKEMDSRIQSLSAAAKGGGLHDEFVSTEISLHIFMYDLTDNAKLKSIIIKQQSLFARMWFSVERTGLDLDGQIEDWKAIHKALCDKDESMAASLTQKHFQTFYNHLRIHF